MVADIPDLLAKRAELSPDKIALEEVATGRCLTYAELDRRAGQAASLMASRGVKEGDRVAILCRNRIAFFELLFGCARLGAILVPLNWRMPGFELHQLVEDCSPSLLFAGRDDRASVEALAIPAIDLDGDYERMLHASAPGRWRSRWPSESIWYLIYTSGTTGWPKGVIYNFRMALANYVNIGSAIDLRSSDTTLTFLPLFHTAGINLHSLPTLFAGGRVVILDGFDEEAVVRLLEERRLDTFFAVPTVYQALLDHPRFASASLDHVRHWGCGGAPLPDSVAEQYRDLRVRICNGMGMTETGPTAFLMNPADAWDRIGSVGKPQLLCSVRIVDEEGRDVRDDEVGDLLFSGPGITPGYWNDAETTRAAFTADGWLRSGDLARRDADGFYHVAGRRKEMFISGGENVYPVEVENVLAAHPAVAEAAVVPVPDSKWGEVARAFIVAASDVRPAPEELQAFCRARLAAYKVPRSFQFVADFPRTASGKIRKHAL
ncbi:class I adenylate-forming enzyme family protein [Sphingosinicella humi]|uniref:3-methylmercaptopropionyl-CoA ligase n=1 Tax=Allosphingosinicella humi TaxID=2068657 RepID=A0A2U2J4G8_9SPHN|nr:AMP-binding protein [Sphingosinicella humi]PWG03243.1 acid--CoA ligase [Sphingosinicella humi]